MGNAEPHGTMTSPTSERLDCPAPQGPSACHVVGWSPLALGTTLPAARVNGVCITRSPMMTNATPARVHLRCWAPILVVIAFAACRSHEKSSPPATGSAEPSAAPSAHALAALRATESFCKLMLEARMKALTAKCPEADRSANLYHEQINGWASGFETCRAMTAALYGRAVLHEDKAAACMAALQKGIEADPMIVAGIADHPECAGVFEGNGKEGEACTLDIECSDGLRCDRPAGASPSQSTTPPPASSGLAPAEGTCRPPGALGASCDEFVLAYTGVHPRCQAGLFCDHGKCVPENSPLWLRPRPCRTSGHGQSG